MWRHRDYIILYLIASLVAIPHLLTTLAPYDDEGYVMMTIQSFASHHPLYEETHTQYGPAYYLITETIHSCFHLPLTQHGVRLKTALYWALTSVIGMAIVHRLSGNRPIAWMTGALIALHIDKLALEPGHPQELALLTSLLSLWCINWLSIARQAGGRHLFYWGLSAAFATVCAMTKLNCGFVLIFPLVATAVWQWPATGGLGIFRQFATAAVCVVPCIAIGATMLRSYLSVYESVTSFSVIVPLVLCGCWVTVIVRANLLSHRFQTSLHSTLPMVVVTVTGLSLSALIAIWTYWQGTSWAQLYWGLVGQHTNGFTQSFFHPLPISTLTIAMCLGFGLYRRNRKVTSWLIVATVCLTVAMLSGSIFSTLEHGLVPRGAAEWLVVIGPISATLMFAFRSRLTTGRIMLSGLTVLSPWIAFPTPGTQVAMGTVPGLLTLGVLLADAVQYLQLTHDTLRGKNWFAIKSAPRYAMYAACSMAIAMSLTTCVRWKRSESLGLPGSEWIHVSKDVAERNQSIAKQIADSDAEFLVFDGHTHNRFYFWTHCKPLTAANPTFWPRMLTAREQKAWQSAIENSRSLCVVIPSEANTLAGGHAESLRKTMLTSIEVKEIPQSDWRLGIRKQEAMSGTH